MILFHRSAVHPTVLGAGAIFYFYVPDYFGLSSYRV